MPKVSVIIPNYNHAKYLEKRIQSILHQTYQDFEIIYLDDASSDDSNQVFSQFADNPKITAIFNEKNSGSPFKQWNKGVKNSSGEYIWIAESDDYADKTFLATLVDKLDKYPNVGLAYCESWMVDGDDNILKSFKETLTYCDSKRWEEDFINNGKAERDNFLLYENTIPNASGILIRRSIYEQAGYANETMRLSSDWMLWAKILLISDIAFVAEPLNYFRTHLATVRHKTTLNGLAFEEGYKILAHFRDNLSLKSEINEEIYDVMIEKWMGIFFAKESEIPWSRNYKIYQLANQLDSKTNYRLMQNILMRIKRRIHKKISY